jgi:hypothetical protein
MTDPSDAGGPSELRTAARVACQVRGLDHRPVWDWLPFLAEDMGRLVNAVRREDPAAVQAEVAAATAILDRLAELYDGRELAVLVGERAAAGEPLPPTPASRSW